MGLGTINIINKLAIDSDQTPNSDKRNDNLLTTKQSE